MKYKDFYSALLTENLQLAEKLYFSTGVLNDRWKKFILDITHGDFTTKIISDIIVNKLKSGTVDLTKKEIDNIYNELKNYNKNVFPIIGFDYNNKSNVFDYNVLVYRKKVIDILNSFPEIAKRNLKEDIRKERSIREMVYLENTLDYISSQLQLLNNRGEEMKNKMYRKIFSSGNTTFSDIVHFLEEKENLVGGKEFSREDIMELVKKHQTPIVYDKNGVIILDIQNQTEMKAFGENSTWCFTYGSEEGQGGDIYDDYSYNGHVYLIIDTREKSDSPEFMYVLIKPIPQNSFHDFYDQINKQQHFKFSYLVKSNNQDDNVLYDLTNNPIDNPIYTIYKLVGDDLDVFNVFKFEE